MLYDKIHLDYLDHYLSTSTYLLFILLLSLLLIVIYLYTQIVYVDQ